MQPLSYTSLVMGVLLACAGRYGRLRPLPAMEGKVRLVIHSSCEATLFSSRQ